MTTGKLLVSCGVSLLCRAALSPLKLLPIRKKRVLFVSFRGKQYSCNPRAVSEALEDSQAEIVWAFHQPEKFAFLRQRGIRVISDRGLRFVLTALTARVVCTNTYYKPFLPRRRGQFFLRTWHGGGAYKRVDYPGGLRGFYIRLQQQGASVYLSSSAAFTWLVLRESFGYHGEVLEAGLPRNDLLLSPQRDEIGDRVRRELVPEGKHIALFAPTYRETGKVPAPDMERLKQALSARFGGEWIVLGRGHHVTASEKERTACDLDVTDYPDMQPLLCAADVLVTDYSSSIWDMSLTGKPVFLFCPDLKAYRAERDFYTDIHTWPFPLAETDEALENNIHTFDASAYARDIACHHETLGSTETGHASRLAAERICKEIGN